MNKEILKKFSEWFNEAEQNNLIKDHTEMSLATADKQGRPSVRIVLLKNFDERGFVFYTNYNGRKSKQISENPFASLCFYWPALDKQIRIEGRVEKVSPQESDKYFSSRAEESRIGAITSKQSEILETREKFLSELDENRKKFLGKEIPRPENWGGWRVIPDYVEFWQAGEFRIHHREVYRKINNVWNLNLLYP
ncbi:MAG: pyridoxamine 5'-phosphate oxidase [Rickettsiales bacterium]|nr:pyridoxamine 5'-phosphate oxidase [Rickettsiales bacterium]